MHSTFDFQAKHNQNITWATLVHYHRTIIDRYPCRQTPSLLITSHHFHEKEENKQWKANVTGTWSWPLQYVYISIICSSDPSPASITETPKKHAWNTEQDARATWFRFGFVKTRIEQKESSSTINERLLSCNAHQYKLEQTNNQRKPHTNLVQALHRTGLTDCLKDWFKPFQVHGNCFTPATVVKLPSQRV